jgi:hypothetical protein
VKPSYLYTHNRPIYTIGPLCEYENLGFIVKRIGYIGLLCVRLYETACICTHAHSYYINCKFEKRVYPRSVGSGRAKNTDTGWVRIGERVRSTAVPNKRA